MYDDKGNVNILQDFAYNIIFVNSCKFVVNVNFHGCKSALKLHYICTLTLFYDYNAKRPASPAPRNNHETSVAKQHGFKSDDFSSRVVCFLSDYFFRNL